MNKIILFWCSLSPRRAKFIMLDELKDMMLKIMMYCFFNCKYMEFHISRRG
jgi:hypothetical protein